MLKEIPLKSIKVEDRGRKDFGDLMTLRDSIMRHGIISAILVEEIDDPEFDWLLVAGERRYKASILAGRESIPAGTRKDLSAIARKEIELEENIHRKELLWSETVQMEASLDEIKRKEHGDNAGSGNRHTAPSWTIKDTAVLLQKSVGQTAQDLQLAKAMGEDKELAMELMKYPKTVAFKKMKHLQEKKRLERKYESGTAKPTSLDYFRNESCTEGIKNVADEFIDLVITDPPFAVEQIESAKGTYNKLRAGDDNSSEDIMKQVYNDLLPELYRTMKPGAHLYMFFANEWYGYLVNTLKLYGFHVSPCPIIWDKLRTTTPFRGYDYQQQYEPILFCCKEPRGERQLNKASCNILKYPPVDQKTKIHVFHKNPALIDFLVMQSSHPGQVVCDPFAGSGQTLESAQRLGREVVGFELSTDHYNRAINYLTGGKKDDDVPSTD
jgi:DNA modification methylase